MDESSSLFPPACRRNTKRQKILPPYKVFTESANAVSPSRARRLAHSPLLTYLPPSFARAPFLPKSRRRPPLLQFGRQERSSAAARRVFVRVRKRAESARQGVTAKSCHNRPNHRTTPKRRDDTYVCEYCIVNNLQSLLSVVMFTIKLHHPKPTARPHKAGGTIRCVCEESAHPLDWINKISTLSCLPTRSRLYPCRKAVTLSPARR